MAWTYSLTYTQVHDYSVKDGLSSGDPEKIVLGADIDAELSGIASALNEKLDSGSVSSAAEAAAGTDSESVMTPQRVTSWADSTDNGGGHVGELWRTSDPAADRILFYDFSAGAGSMLSQLTVGNGLEISGTTLQLPASLAGNGLTLSSGVLAVQVGEGIKLESDTVKLSDSSHGAGNPISLVDGTFSFNMASLGTINIENADQAADALLYSDNGTLKLMPLDVIGTKIVASSTKNIDGTDDVGVIHVNTTASNHTMTVVPESTYDFPIGTEMGFLTQGTGTIIFVAGSGVTINSLNSNLTVKASGGGAYLVKTGSNIWSLIGDLQ